MLRIFSTISHIQNVLINDLPQDVVEKTGVEKLSNNDLI
jgi:hypothetical protein